MLGAIWKRWNWLDDGLIPLAATLMYAAWSYPLLALFLRDPSTGTQSSGFTFWLCLGVLSGGVIAGRLADQNRLGIVIVVAGGLAALLVSLLLTLPTEAGYVDIELTEILGRAMRGSRGEVVPAPIIAVIGATILWWRGLRIASQPEHEETTGSFLVGVIALGGLLLIALVLQSSEVGGRRSLPQFWQTFFPCLAPALFFGSIVAAAFAFISRAERGWGVAFIQLIVVASLLSLAPVLPLGPSPEALVGWVLLFLASGLTALALMGVSRTLREQERMTGVRMRADRYWVVTTLGIVVGVLVLGLTLGQLLAPDPFVRALGWLKPIWTFLVQVLLIIVFIFAYLFFSLIEPLLAEVQGRPARLPTFVSPLQPESIEELAAKEAVEVPPIFGTILQILLVLGVVALIAAIFLAAVRKRKRRVRIEAEEIVETRETILSMDLLRSQLSDLLNALRRKRPPPLFLDLDTLDDSRKIVRELYQKVLARAIELDLPRSKEQTPSAYQRTLAHACAEERSSLETLTLIYLIARYGSVPPTHEQVREAQEAFARIDIVLQTPVKQV